jgi:hypothetical protein
MTSGPDTPREPETPTLFGTTAAVQRIRDLLHALREMSIPVLASAHVLEELLDTMFGDLDRCLETHRIPPGAAEDLRSAWAGVRDSYHELNQMSCDAAEACSAYAGELTDVFRRLTTETVS